MYVVKFAAWVSTPVFGDVAWDWSFTRLTRDQWNLIIASVVLGRVAPTLLDFK